MCLASMTPPRVDPIADAHATAQGLRDTAELCRDDQAALAARLLIAAAVIDGLLAKVKASAQFDAYLSEMLNSGDGTYRP